MLDYIATGVRVCVIDDKEHLDQERTCYPTMRVELTGHFQPCTTKIYLHIDARMADYIHTHPYIVSSP